MPFVIDTVRFPVAYNRNSIIHHCDMYTGNNKNSLQKDARGIHIF